MTIDSPRRGSLTAYVADFIPALRQAIEVTTQDGCNLDHRTYAVRGTADNPMSRDEEAAKAFDILAPVLGEERARTLVDRVWSVELLASARQLRPLLGA